MDKKYTKNCRLCKKRFHNRRFLCNRHGRLIQGWVGTYGFMAANLWLDRWKYPLETVEELKIFKKLVGD